MDAPLQLTRYSAPTKMDIAPYLSVCKVASGKDNVELYVQRNTDDMDPKWEYIAEVSIETKEEKIQELVSERLHI